jgi:hypothetical protein
MVADGSQFDLSGVAFTPREGTRILHRTGRTQMATIIKCIVCAKRTNQNDIQKAFTCTSCTEFLSANDFQFTGESIESYTASFAGVLARPENSEFLQEILQRRQEQKQSVLDAIASVMTKVSA